MKAADVDKILDNSEKANKTGLLPELQKRARTSQQIQDLLVGNNVAKAIANTLGLQTSTRTAYDSLADLISMPGSYINESGKLFAPTGGSTMFGPSGVTQGLFGQVTYTGAPNPDYTGPFADLVNGDMTGPDEGGREDDEVKPVNPLTGVVSPATHLTTICKLAGWTRAALTIPHLAATLASLEKHITGQMHLTRLVSSKPFMRLITTTMRRPKHLPHKKLTTLILRARPNAGGWV